MLFVNTFIRFTQVTVRAPERDKDGAEKDFFGIFPKGAPISSRRDHVLKHAQSDFPAGATEATFSIPPPSGPRAPGWYEARLYYRDTDILIARVTFELKVGSRLSFECVLNG